MKLRSLIMPIIMGCGMLAASVSAQLSIGGTPPSFEMATKATVPTVTTGKVDVQKLLAEDEQEAKLGIPFRFGFPFDVHYDLSNSGIWEKLEDGTKLWRLRIECPGAYSTNLIFDDFFLPPGAKLYLYNDDRSMINGAFTSQNNKETGVFATAPVKGSTCTLELSIPADVNYPGRLRISRIVHGYKDVFFNPDKDFGGSGSCNNNVHCPVGDPWANEIRAVAMITTSGGFRLCTGSMVNNVRQDLTPYFLTANHCLGGEATWVFIFNYESPNCSNIDGPTWMSVSGCTLRATSTYSDFALLELSAQPPDSYNVFYGGWSAIDTAASSVVGIHHPQGDIKKISFDYDPVTSTEYLGTTPGVTHWRIGSWDDGTTEPGSSGSPIYDPNHHVVGQLHGGYASCTSITSDYYGKFSQSWAHGTTASTQLKHWLDPDNTGVMMLDGRDGAGIKIDHTPLTDTRDTLNDYVVTATITSNASLVADSLLLYYQLSSVWYNSVLQPTGNINEFSSSIPSQSPGTVIEYYLYAVDVEGKADTTAVYTFRVIDYGVTLTPSADSGRGAPGDTLWYNLTVTNTGIFSDDYSLSLSSAGWPTGLYDASGTVPVSSTGSLLQDETFACKVRVLVPVSTYGQFDTVVVTATSTGDNSYTASSRVKSTSEGSPLSVPVVDDFVSTTIDQGTWVKNVNCESNATGLNEPSAPYSLNLDGNPSGADTLMSQAIDLSAQSNIIVRYYYEQTGGGDAPETGDDLYVECLDSLGTWQLLGHHLGADPDMTTYAEVSVAIPASAYHRGFRLRFRNKGTTGNFDDWFVDDVYVGEPPAYEVALTPSSQGQYGPSGLSTAYTLVVHNKGLNTDTYDLAATQNSWAVTFYDATGSSVISQAGPVAAAESLTIQAWVAVPPGAVMSDIDTALITATSVNDPLASATALLATTSAGPPGGFPWFEPFPEAGLNAIRWISNHGATIATNSLNPPSSPYALNLDGGIDTVVSQLIDLSGQSGVILSYYYERGGSADPPEAGDDFWVEYRNQSGSWVEVAHYLGGDPVMSSYASVNVGLPADAYYNGFQLRLRSFGTGVGTDNWYVDDIRVDYAPSLTASPVSLSETLSPPDSSQHQLVIGNDGPGSLVWSLRVILTLNKANRFAQLLASGEVLPAHREYPAGFDDYVEPKGATDSRQGFPTDKNAGGPDLYGYVWLDSDEPGGPSFVWQEVSGTGIDVVGGLTDDNFIGPYALGFAFPFYGTLHNQIYIGSNGIIGFDTAGMSSRFKKAIPTSSTPNNLLAWLWDDLNPLDADNPGVHVYVDTTGGRCVIEFVNYPEYGAAAGDVITAEVILSPDGVIVYQYKTIAAGFDILANTVGIENGAGTDGLEVSYLSAYLHDNLAIRFSSPYRWLTVDQTSGSLAPNTADTLACWFHAGDLADGVYQGQLMISSNDPAQPSYPVDATLTVSAAPSWLCGDTDGNGEGPDIADLVYLVDYMFGQPAGPAPVVFQAADVNGDGSLDIADLVYLVEYQFNSGPAPTCGL